ncbi:MAG: ECF-type sigma factor [Verrucomicrobiota bacterium]
MNEATCLLQAIQEGDPHAAEAFLALVYRELRGLASAKMGREQPGQTLQPTALVHEAWLRIGGIENRQWQNRAHFFAAAAEAMRRILIERARRKLAIRHGAGHKPLDVHELEIAAPGRDEELLAIDEALEKLALHSPQKAELVKLRYFAGLTIEEAAEVLGISVPGAKRHWAYARAWLYAALRPG